jgi:predicted metal-dependent peptidase
MAAEQAHPGHRGTRAIQRMVEYAPSTGGLALWVKHGDLPEVPAVNVAHHAAVDAPPAATDGHTIFYAAAFAELPLPEQTGLVAHEVLHIALRHPQRCADLRQLLGDVDNKLFNTCADAIVNSTLAHLAWLQLPASAVLLDTLLLRSLGLDQAVEKSLLEWDVERLYRAIDDRRTPGQNGKREDGPRSATVRALGDGSPEDLMHAAATQDKPEAQAEAAREWSERLVRAHAGDGAFSMLRVLMADLPSTRTPWEQVLRTQLARALSTRPGISWSRPARSYIANQGRMGRLRHQRLPWEPGFSGTKPVPRLVVIVDVSGSIDDALMDRFAREIEAITRRLEAGLVLVIGDDCVRRVAHFEPGRSDLREIQFNGGGGTDFTPLLEEANQHQPDIAVVLTDLDGPARFRPRWPVIWAVPEAHSAAVAPFGRTLSLN